MKTLLLTLFAATALQAATITNYTNPGQFVHDLNTPVEFEYIGMRYVLVPLQPGIVFSFEEPVIAAGLFLNTIPEGPGTGVDLKLIFSDGHSESCGFWGGNGSNVVGFRGCLSDEAFVSLVLATGGMEAYGIQETLDVSKLKFGVATPPLASQVPEPNSAVMLGIGMLALSLGMFYRRRREAA